MKPLRTRAELLEVVDRPWPAAEIRPGHGGRPACRARLESLDEVCRQALGPLAVRWTDGVPRWSEAALAYARLHAAVEPEEDWASAPAGVVDRLLAALDRAGGYPAEPLVAGGWVAGVLPGEPAAALFVRAYDFATLVAAERAATVELAGTALRVDVLAYPLILAAALRAGEDPGAPPLVDEALARRLPFGAARALVELADRLSEVGDPAAAVRFLDPAEPPAADPAQPLAVAPHGPLSE